MLRTVTYLSLKHIRKKFRKDVKRPCEFEARAAKFIQDCPYEMTGTAIMASRKSFSADLFACRIVSQTSPFLSPNLTAGGSVRQCRRAWAMTSLMRVDMCGQLLRDDSQSTRTKNIFPTEDIA